MSEIRQFRLYRGDDERLALATINVLLEINFANINENTCLMYTVGATPWLSNQTAQFTAIHKNEVLREVKQACLTALLELYAPFVDTEQYLQKSIPITRSQYIAIMNFNNTNLSDLHTLEAIKLMMTAEVLKMSDDGSYSSNENSLTPNEMRQKLVPGSFSEFTVENCSLDFIRYHALRLWLLYVLCGARIYQPKGKITNGWFCKLVANIPCRTPEGVIGLTSLDRYRANSKLNTSQEFKVLETMPHEINVADEYIWCLMESLR